MPLTSPAFAAASGRDDRVESGLAGDRVHGAERRLPLSIRVGLDNLDDIDPGICASPGAAIVYDRHVEAQTALRCPP